MAAKLKKEKTYAGTANLPVELGRNLGLSNERNSRFGLKANLAAYIPCLADVDRMRLGDGIGCHEGSPLLSARVAGIENLRADRNRLSFTGRHNVIREPVELDLADGNGFDVVDEIDTQAAHHTIFTVIDADAGENPGADGDIQPRRVHARVGGCVVRVVLGPASIRDDLEAGIEAFTSVLEGKLCDALIIPEDDSILAAEGPPVIAGVSARLKLLGQFSSLSRLTLYNHW